MSGEAVLQVIYRDPRDLTPYKGNARTHSPEQIAQIAASIREFGFASPILLKDDETQIGAGHARREAALLLGLTSVPTITLHGLSESKWRAFVLADNKLALNAGWDEDVLRAEIEALGAEDIDLDLLGFGDDELDALLNTASELEDMPDLPSGDRGPFQQMTFTLHDDQVEAVRRAMTLATADGPYDGSPNANGNGNALARICAEYTVQRALG